MRSTSITTDTCGSAPFYWAHLLDFLNIWSGHLTLLSTFIPMNTHKPDHGRPKEHSVYQRIQECIYPTIANVQANVAPISSNLFIHIKTLRFFSSPKNRLYWRQEHSPCPIYDIFSIWLALLFSVGLLRGNKRRRLQQCHGV